MPKRKIVEWYGKLEKAPLFPDIRYWTRRGDAAKFRAAWGMVIESHLIKGEDLRGKRLQRSVEHFQQRKR